MSEASQCLERGREHVRAKRFAQATAELSKAIELEPEIDSDAYVYRAYARRSLGDRHAAIADYTKAIDMDSENSYAWYSRGLTLRELGQIPEAIADFDQAITLKRDYVDAYLARGTAFGVQGRHMDQVAECLNALRYSPGSAKAYYYRGVALRSAGDNSSAIEDFTQVLEFKPDDTRALLNRAYLYHQVGQTASAVEDYTEAIRLSPRDHSAYFNRAIANKALGRRQEAVDDYTKLLELRPNWTRAHSNRARLYEDLGVVGLARSGFEDALRLVDGYPTSLKEADVKHAREYLIRTTAPRTVTVERRTTPVAVPVPLKAKTQKEPKEDYSTEQITAFADLAISLTPGLPSDPEPIPKKKLLGPLSVQVGRPVEGFTPRRLGISGPRSIVPLRKRRAKMRRRPQRSAVDLAGLQHLSETLGAEEWGALVRTSRARNTLAEIANRTTIGGGRREDIDEEEEEGEVPTGHHPISRLLLVPVLRWIPEKLVGSECGICMGVDIQGNGLYCPGCRVPLCDECSCCMVRDCLSEMQTDLAAFPPQCSCCHTELILGNFEYVLNHVHPDITRKGTKKSVLVSQYELVMIAAAFDRDEETMAEKQISCPFCKCLTLYEDLESVVILRCQNDACGKCYCWRCNIEVPVEAWARYCQLGSAASGVDEIVSHYTRCRSLDHIRKDVEDAISWGAVNRCPTCHIPGQKDTACTHISCSNCPRWCYVCEGTISDGHNNNWETNSNHCPMYLQRIHDFDSKWPSDATAAVQYYHKQKTLRALREVVDKHGLVSIALLKQEIPGIFGGFSIGQIMKIAVDEPLYVRRSRRPAEPATPTTESLLRADSDAPPEPAMADIPAPPRRQVSGVGLSSMVDTGPGADVFVRGSLVYSQFSFDGHGAEEMAVHEGDVLRVMTISEDRVWVFVYHVRFGKSGYVPRLYLKPVDDLRQHREKYDRLQTGPAPTHEAGLMLPPPPQPWHVDPSLPRPPGLGRGGAGGGGGGRGGKILRRAEVVEASEEAVRRATGRS